MKNHFIFYFLLILIFTFSSCSKEEALPLSAEERIQQALQTLETQQEIDFFDLDFVTRKHPQLLPSVRTRDDRSDWIDSVYQHILLEHQELSIVPAMIQQFGYPVWNESDLLEDEEGLGIPALLIPFIRLDQNHISAYLLSVPTGSGDWHFIMVDRPTLDLLLADPDSGNHTDLRFHIAAYTRFDALLFGTKNQTYMDWLVEKGDLAYGEEWDVVSPRSYSYEYKYCVEWLVPFTSGDTRDGDGCKRWVYITVNVCTPTNNNPSNSSDPSFGSGPIGGIISAGGIPHNSNNNSGTTPVDDPLSDPTSLMDLCSQFDAATGFEGTPQDLEALNQLGVSLDYLASNCAAIQVVFNSNLFSNAEIAAMLQADNGAHSGLLVQIANRVINNGDPTMINQYVALIDQTDLAFKGFEMLWMFIEEHLVDVLDGEEINFLLVNGIEVGNELKNVYIKNEINIPVEFLSHCINIVSTNSAPKIGELLESYISPEFLWMLNPVDSPQDEEIKNGIEIVSLTVAPENAGGPVIGSNTPRGNTEDLEHGINGDKTGIYTFMTVKNDDELFTNMKNLINFFTSFDGELRFVANSMVDHFQESTGEAFENTVLSQKVKESKAMKNFIKEFGSRLRTELQNSEGNIESISIDLENLRPIFNSSYDRFTGLTITINDTEYTEVQLLNFVIDESTGEWQASLLFDIKDHFGLDKTDALEYQPYHFGFAAWWLLQHTRDYVPFETIIRIGATISGDITP